MTHRTLRVSLEGDLERAQALSDELTIGLDRSTDLEEACSFWSEAADEERDHLSGEGQARGLEGGAEVEVTCFQEAHRLTGGGLVHLARRWLEQAHECV